MDVRGLEAIVFDFDGVLTDNRVYFNQHGEEMVVCSRADGLAFEALRRLPLKLFILSTEANPVVRARGQKLQVPVVQGLRDKYAALVELAAQEGFQLAHTLYVGNDLNDLKAMKACGLSACPADGHATVLAAATFRLRTSGGAGVVRELLEEILEVDVLKVLES